MFEKGELYDRQSDIHEKFGGNRQSGIASCANHPYIFLFSSPRGEEYGYEDGWISADEYRYAGEGQVGDMEMVRGNRIVLNHLEMGKELHLFEKRSAGVYEYIGEFICKGHIKVTGKDALGVGRQMIMFSLCPVHTTIAVTQNR